MSQAPPVTAQVTIGEIVRLVFTGWPKGHYKTNEPLRLSWNNRPVSIVAGSEAHVPFEMVKLYFGDPRAIDSQPLRIKDEYGNDMIVPDRTAEIIRLKQFWQDSSFRTNQAKFREYIPGDRSWLDENNGRISDLIPDVEVWTLSGERIYTVVDDPFGDRAMFATPTRYDQQKLQNQLIEQSDVISELRKQNKLLISKLGLDPDTLEKEVSPPSQPSSLTTPEDATVEEKPQMFYNPRTRRVTNKRPIPGVKPNKIEDLEMDTD